MSFSSKTRPKPRRVISRSPQIQSNNAVALYGLAEIFAEAELDSESIASYERALQNDKELTEIYVPLASCITRLAT